MYLTVGLLAHKADWLPVGCSSFGASYRGTLAVTIFGQTCATYVAVSDDSLSLLAWLSWPHRCMLACSWGANSTNARAAFYTTTRFPSAGLGNHNYCRNPVSLLAR